MKPSKILIQIAGLAILAGSVGSTWAQTRIPETYAAPTGSVDVTKRGFKVRISQIEISRFPGDANSVENAERQLANGYINDATGMPYDNLADLTLAGADGLFIDTDVINWNQDGPTDPGPPPLGEGNFRPDEAIPGIPGTTASTDNIAAEILTFLELPAGTTRLGVNSDDGFKVTVGVGTNPKDGFAIQAGLFSGGRGASNSEFDIIVDRAGIYPVRLAWWEGQGGASVEFYSFVGTTRVLINDPANASAIKAYYQATTAAAPYARSVTPTPGSTSVDALPQIKVELLDQGGTVSQGTISLTLDGATVAPQISKVADVTTVSFTSATVLAAESLHTARIVFGDGTRLFTNEWSFRIQNYVTLNPAFAQPAGAVDTNKPGFRVKVVQATTPPELPHTFVRVEAQLAGTLTNAATGLPYENLANLTLAGADGYFVDENVINWNQDAPSAAGNFSANSLPPFEDEPIPGIPGSELTTDNVAAEVLTYLRLKAGLYRMGVNSDDGFRVTTGTNPRDAFSPILGQFEGTRGSADSIFDFLVTQEGIYPFRLLWEEGGGGANLEWFTVNLTTGEKVLVNDRANANGVEAYREGLELSYVKSASPAAGARGVAGNANLQFTIVEVGSGVNTNTVQLFVNDTQVSPTTTRSGTNITVFFDPPQDFQQETTNTVRLVFTTAGTTPVGITNQLSFSVISALSPAPPRKQDTNGRLVIEAETFERNLAGGGTTWIVTQSIPGFSGTGAMLASPDGGRNVNIDISANPRMDYKVRFTTNGTHYVWVRAHGDSSPGPSASDSVNVGIDNTLPSTSDRISTFPSDQEWAWSKASMDGGDATLEIATAGDHLINIWMREDGLIVDKILLTTDVNYTPVDMGPPESARVRSVLFVVGSVTLNAGDQAVANRLVSQGYELATKQANDSRSEDASGNILVVVSSTVGSGQVTTKFKDVNVPVLQWEQALQDDFQMTGNVDGTDRGTVGAQTALNILLPDHPLAGGLAAGVITVAASDTTFTWGNPQGDAIKVASLAADPARVAIYGYETGAAMLGTFKAPAKRITVFLGDTGLTTFNADGLKLWDAAVAWAVLPSGGGNTNTPPTVSITRNGGNVTISSSSGGTVQASDTLVPANWVDFGAAPQTVPTSGQARFFRVRK